MRSRPPRPSACAGSCAPQLRRGRLFVIGDAAHEVSPIGGQGMNLGLLDAVGLAPLLARWVRERRSARRRARGVGAPPGALGAYAPGSSPRSNTVLGRPRRGAADRRAPHARARDAAPPLGRGFAWAYSMGLDAGPDAFRAGAAASSRRPAPEPVAARAARTAAATRASRAGRPSAPADARAPARVRRRRCTTTPAKISDADDGRRPARAGPSSTATAPTTSATAASTADARASEPVRQPAHPGRARRPRGRAARWSGAPRRPAPRRRPTPSRRRRAADRPTGSRARAAARSSR